ncbi:hypothetical protein EVAR_8120_1 [Eumeta japonica]|uniref:Uncharacterized protein n=1 Tax=Eumeta variegata TaxID=151549 RepID=A0A4C1TT21_EUMVA|nr:hypothetical protein EVAR_8120_1 [Eumeta japonica]
MQKNSIERSRLRGGSELDRERDRWRTFRDSDPRAGYSSVERRINRGRKSGIRVGAQKNLEIPVGRPARLRRRRAGTRHRFYCSTLLSARLTVREIGYGPGTERGIQRSIRGHVYARPAWPTTPCNLPVQRNKTKQCNAARLHFVVMRLHSFIHKKPGPDLAGHNGRRPTDDSDL